MSIVFADDWLTVHHGDARAVLAELEPESAQTCITSPPYWGLRDYGNAGQLGLEATPEAYVANLVAVFREVRRVLRKDGTVWLNLGDSYVTDRTTAAHEMVYLLTKSARYHYDIKAIAEPTSGPDNERNRFGARLDVGSPGGIHRSGRTAATYRESQLSGSVSDSTERQRVGINARWDESEANGIAPLTRNKRSVWTIATQPYPEAHFATFPEKLIEPMILAGCPEGGVVLDPFSGSGTVALVAQRFGRKAVLIDLSADYIAQAIHRIAAGRSAGNGPAVDIPVPFAGDGLWAAAEVVS